MRSSEYLKTAYRHLSSCLSILDQIKEGPPKFETNVLLELWYLSGYVLEGITVFLIYKNDDWDEQDDIKAIYNSVFSCKTKVDFYETRIIKKGQLFKQDKNTPCKSAEPQKLKNKYNIHSHSFQKIIKDKFRVDSRYDILPYFGNGIPIEADVEYLIDNWDPTVRYAYYEGTQFVCEKQLLPKLNYDVVKRLLLACLDIYTKILFVV